jgi:MFS family permease
VTKCFYVPARAGLLERVREEFAFIKGNYAVLVVSWLIMDFAMEVPATYYALYVMGLGASETVVGLIGLCYSLALASMQFPGGYIADRFGRKQIICTMTFGVALSYSLFALAPSWHFILLGSVLVAIFNSTYQPALTAMIADSLPPEKRGMGFSIVTLISTASTTPGPIVAALLCSSLGLMTGMRVAYAMLVLLFLTAAVLRTLYLKETLEVREGFKVAELLRNYPIALRESVAVFKRLPRSLVFLVLTAAMSAFAFSAIYPFMPVYAIRELLVSEVLWGLMLTTIPITTIASSIPAGKLIDKVGRKKPLLIATASFALSAYLFVLGGLPILISSLALIGAGSVMSQASFSSLMADLTPMEDRGKVNAFFNFIASITVALGSFTGGFLYEHVSPRSPFHLAMLLGVASLIIMTLFIEEPKVRER